MSILLIEPHMNWISVLLIQVSECTRFNVDLFFSLESLLVDSSPLMERSIIVPNTTSRRYPLSQHSQEGANLFDKLGTGFFYSQNNLTLNSNNGGGR